MKPALPWVVGVRPAVWAGGSPSGGLGFSICVEMVRKPKVLRLTVAEEVDLPSTEPRGEAVWCLASGAEPGVRASQNTGTPCLYFVYSRRRAAASGKPGLTCKHPCPSHGEW